MFQQIFISYNLLDFIFFNDFNNINDWDDRLKLNILFTKVKNIES